MSRIIITIIILLVIDICAAGLLWFGFTTMQEKKSDEAKHREEIFEEGQKGQRLTALSRSIELAEADRKLLTKYLFDPREENQIRFISQIEGLRASTGAIVTVSALSVSGNRVRADVTLKGSWTQLFHTLRLVEELPTRMLVNRFSVSRVNTAEGQENSDAWSGSLSLEIISLLPTQ